ncbi:inner membrane protein YiaA [Mariniblastus sp.]|jgi:uncharacterized membrane protein YiaA|nr:inner membrane protein YiaA [bacterium]MDA7879856.1 inner membrane protein YiaA [Mariniblastus sp.]MDA7901748.1 inner membrane protein YiaA [bacterium]MDA7902160.1 inner membrane protein YiaA [Mariniblastus sp.]MDB4368679.1 inner membrane protein YiaA [bacterium]
MEQQTYRANKPSNMFAVVSWAALAIGVLGYLIGLWNVELMSIGEKGFYLTIILFALHASVSAQKNVRDQAEGLSVNQTFLMLTWAAVIAPIILLVMGLYNAELPLADKGFYGIAFIMSMFAAVSVQKNTRDIMQYEKQTKEVVND